MDQYFKDEIWFILASHTEFEVFVSRYIRNGEFKVFAAVVNPNAVELVFNSTIVRLFLCHPKYSLREKIMGIHEPKVFAFRKEYLTENVKECVYSARGIIMNA